MVHLHCCSFLGIKQQFYDKINLIIVVKSELPGHSWSQQHCGSQREIRRTMPMCTIFKIYAHFSVHPKYIFLPSFESKHPWHIKWKSPWHFSLISSSVFPSFSHLPHLVHEIFILILIAFSRALISAFFSIIVVNCICWRGARSSLLFTDLCCHSNPTIQIKHIINRQMSGRWSISWFLSKNLLKQRIYFKTVLLRHIYDTTLLCYILGFWKNSCEKKVRHFCITNAIYMRHKCDNFLTQLRHNCFEKVSHLCRKIFVPFFCINSYKTLECNVKNVAKVLF